MHGSVWRASNCLNLSGMLSVVVLQFLGTLWVEYHLSKLPPGHDLSGTLGLAMELHACLYACGSHPRNSNIFVTVVVFGVVCYGKTGRNA